MALVRAPGVVWLMVLFLTPLYAILAVAMGTPDPIFGDTLPVWNPLQWDPRPSGTFSASCSPASSGSSSCARSSTSRGDGLEPLIGYPVAYYVARHAGR